jgi:hypothetical protein
MSAEDQALDIFWTSLSEYLKTEGDMQLKEVKEACFMAARVFCTLFPQPDLPDADKLAEHFIDETVKEWRR